MIKIFGTHAAPITKQRPALSVLAAAIAIALMFFYGCSNAPQPQKESSQANAPKTVYDSMKETSEIQTREDENSGQENEGSREEGDAVNGNVGGGNYSNLWNMSGTVTAISETDMTIAEAGETNVTNYTVDTRTAKQHGRFTSNIDVGTEVTIDYSLYDKEGSTILAQAVYQADR